MCSKSKNKMGKLTPTFINNMNFDEKVNYLLNANLVGDMPDYLYNTVESVLLEFIEQVDECNEKDKSGSSSIFDCLTMKEVKHFVFNTGLRDLNTTNTDKLFTLKSKLKLDIMVLSDSLKVLEDMNNAGNFINKYFEGN